MTGVIVAAMGTAYARDRSIICSHLRTLKSTDVLDCRVISVGTITWAFGEVACVQRPSINCKTSRELVIHAGIRPGYHY